MTKERRNGEPGRRSYDRGYCVDHPFIQGATKDHRELVCGKIAALKLEVAKMVSWKIYAFLFGFSVLVVGSGFGFFGTQIGKLSDKHETAMDTIQLSLGKLETNQAVMFSEAKLNQVLILKEIDVIKQRQDVLRDMSIKSLGEKK